MSKPTSKVQHRIQLQSQLELLEFDMQTHITKYTREIQRLELQKQHVIFKLQVYEPTCDPEFNFKGDKHFLQAKLEEKIEQTETTLKNKKYEIKQEVQSLYVAKHGLKNNILEQEVDPTIAYDVQQLQSSVKYLQEKLLKQLDENSKYKEHLQRLTSSINTLRTQKSQFSVQLYEKTRERARSRIETDFLYAPRKAQQNSEYYEETDSEQLAIEDDKKSEVQTSTRKLPPIINRLNSQLDHIHDECKKREKVVKYNYDFLLKQIDNFVQCKDKLKKGIKQIIKRRKPHLAKQGFLEEVGISSQDSFLFVESILDDGLLDVILQMVLIDDIDFNYQETKIPQRVGIQSKAQGLRKTYDVRYGLD
ncbi:hypothetical protein SS50377_23175 [Spironucleus salmonicida]|uniref:Uncharacterized protein n=1 Tax=Spironucleus salmonicida TaxID=348837 RepID=V6LLQ7_9EUKA|nr:hypothetical protein SS50377_23175 [Spironucleus salmonicida]|eukprot:EST41649.1 Hypothetical protein SS50377_18735 [Spironucleus salmonicida]